MGERTRTFDWSQSPLGPPAEWPQSLKTAVRIMLDSRYAMWLGWGPEFTFFYNDAYAEMTLGPKHPWALGRSAREVWSEIWEEIGPRAESVIETGKATWDEGLLLFLERRGFPEETYHTFSYSPVPDDTGRIGGMLCVVTEDTERTIGERRLRSLRDLSARTMDENKTVEEACHASVETLAENPQDLPFALIYMLEDDGTARLAGSTGLPEGSPAAAARVELRAGEAGWPMQEVLDTGRPVVVEELENRFGALCCPPWPEPVRQAVVVPMAKPGQTRPAGFVVAGISPRLLLDDHYRGFLDLLAGHAATAVANARAYEEERSRAEALAELDRAKTTFFSNVSHEFRTPLTLMLGPVGDLLARSDRDLSPAAKGQLEVVNRNGLRLLRLVNTLLDFSRIEAGRVRATFQPTELGGYTAELASNFRAAVERAGLRLVVDSPALEEPVYVDREMWEKVVLNLLSNALKFTFEGEIAVSLLPAADHVELRVRDTGTGIPAEEMPRLFERFHRIENARGRTHEGTGIGLALVQELVKLHHGSISAESAVGEGTTFRVCLPRGSSHLPPEQVRTDGEAGAPRSGPGAGPFVEEALRWLPDGDLAGGEGAAAGGLAELPPVPAADRSDVARERILIADDNADLRQYLARLLAEYYTVETAPDGEAALASIREQRPDLLLTDVMMPRLDGFGLLHALRADPETRSLPIIMLSARAGEESRVEGMEAGADDYLVKPFSARELLARVSSHLQMARLRREASEAIQKERDWLQVTLASIGDAVITTDTEGRVTFLNGVAEMMTGWTNDAAAGVPLDEVFRIINEESGGPVESPAVRALRDGTIVGLAGHILLRSKAGQEWPIDVSVAPVREADGSVAGGVLVFRDITTRRRAERALRESEAHFRSRSEQLRRLADVATWLNAAPDVATVTRILTEEARVLIGAHQAVTAFVVDRTGERAIHSRSYSEKYTRADEAGGACEGAGLAGLVCRTNLPLRLTQAQLETHPEYRCDGHSPPLRGWLAAPLVARDGRNVGLIQLSDKYADDFTPDDEAVLIQLAQMASVAIENARLLESLRDADRRKDEFLAMLAHELRNPLAPVLNAIQVLRAIGDGDGHAMAQRQRDVIDRQARHMARLLDDLLDVSRITRGKIELRRQDVDFGTAVDQAVEAVRPLLEQRRLAVEVFLPAQRLTVNADPTRLHQIIGNLLNNAAKYTEPGGRVELRVERDGGQAVLKIRDTGMGIPPEFLPRIFDLFTQSERTLSRSEAGLGIGLTMVQSLVQLHGGTVFAESDGAGRGSQFTVRLPLIAAGGANDETGGARTAAAKSPARRVLIVDDNRDAAETLADLAAIWGHDVRTVHDGPSALQAAAEFRPDVMLLDISMPRMSGYEVAQRLRGEPELSGIRLIALTGYGQDEDRRRTREAGFDHHLTKPVDPERLSPLLNEARPA